MVLFKSDVTFKGIEEDEIFHAHKEFEMTVKRAEEVQKKLKERYNINANFERVDKPTEEAGEK